MTRPRPLIGVTRAQDRISPKHPELYEKAIADAGGVVVWLDSSGPADPQECHGLLLPGGGDLSPSLYGSPVLFDIQQENGERTAYEWQLLEVFRLEKKPILGICYGMQAMNVYLGGTLYQDIAGECGMCSDHRSGTHPVSVEINPYIPPGAHEVNSFHHQAVRSLAAPLAPFCVSGDGLVEAFMEKDAFFVGLQWHPERMKGALSSTLFRSFVEACRGA